MQTYDGSSSFHAVLVSISPSAYTCTGQSKLCGQAGGPGSGMWTCTGGIAGHILMAGLPKPQGSHGEREESLGTRGSAQ